MKYFIGIDGGGTKTAFLCYSEDEQLVGEVELSTVHFMQVCDEEAIRVLKEGVGKILPESAKKEDVFVCAGFGGYGKNQEVRKRIQNICAASFSGMNYCIKNDGEIALFGALNGQDGILIIAGTGVIGLAKSGQDWSRCGGWGYLLGDEGSAYWMGRELLMEFCHQNDGRSKKTALSDRVMEELGLQDCYDIIPYMTQKHDRTGIAALAKIVYELAQCGDDSALKIYDEAAKHLASIINTLSENFTSECKVSYAGGVWKANGYIFNPLRKYLKENITIEAPKYTPVYGACLLAREIL